jgi:putative two-component system response regulator
VAVADVFDALMSRRPYKPAFTIEQAVNIIKEGRGHHFDSDVVDVFLGDLPELQRIWSASQEEHQMEMAESLKRSL